MPHVAVSSWLNSPEEEAPPLDAIRASVCGVRREVPLLDGSRRAYVNFDNAATTPAFRAVLDTVVRFMEWYSSIHRGTGYKSQLSSEIYEQCREIVARFVGADPRAHTVVFCCNTTQAINTLCRRMTLGEGEAVLATLMEHHSNMLPWRMRHALDYVGIRSADGQLDLEALEQKLIAGGGKYRLVAVSGASNVTGCLPPLAEIARVVHRHGAKMLVDAAQRIAHRPIAMGPPGGDGSIDFLAFSAHKAYAPFGSGALIGPTEFFAQGVPATAGGGAVRVVTLEEIVWADPPQREEAGTPNVVGALALAKSLRILDAIGMEAVAEHERMLTAHLVQRLAGAQGIRMLGETDPACAHDRLGVVPILSAKYPHGLLASVLSYEYGIAVRHGCFCAHPYLLGLLALPREEVARVVEQIRRGDMRDVPGLVRISLGLYNTAEEIDYLCDSLDAIHKNGPAGHYEADADGHYAPVGFAYEYGEDFLV